MVGRGKLEHAKSSSLCFSLWYNNKNFLPSTLPGGLPIFFVSCHFIFTENKHGSDKLISILKQKRPMLKVRVND